jgi:hypothetical protein
MIDRTRWGTAAAIACALGVAATASADPDVSTSPTTVTQTAPGATATERPHAVYLDVLGKGGLWGLGYDYQALPWLAVGGVVSWYSLNGEHFTTLAPYVQATLFTRGHSHLFTQLGPQIVREATPSPVPEWMGTSTTGIGAEVSAGYEYRNHILLRGYVMGVADKADGILPWLGGSIGWTL